MLILNYERIFLKEFEKLKKRGKNPEKLAQVVDLLINEQVLPVKNRNHKLQGKFKGLWECHIEPDWLLIYDKTTTEIVLIRTGTHSDLF